ncbi:MAG: hypothetical protein OJF52_001850 [Nitrospira sp.]|jgi:hypothetical protein|nr:MAG: hypothetical protein OJF52_001850 [Nitrospira sp.]
MTDPNQNPPSSPSEADPKIDRIKAWLVANVPVIVAFFTVAIFLLIIASIFWPFVQLSGQPQATLLRELSITEVARGLITFLVAVATVGIALILTVYMVVTPDSQAAIVKERFGLAKEVLSTLIGVLGTIVGFYFGSTTTPSAPPPPQVQILTVSNAKLDPLTPKPGGDFTVTAEISGGKPPYNYTIGFSPDKIPSGGEKTSPGKLTEKITVPKDLAPGTTLDVVIEVKDQSGGPIKNDKLGKLTIGQ